MQYERREDKAVGVTQNPGDATFGDGVYLTTCAPCSDCGPQHNASCGARSLCRAKGGIDRHSSGGMTRHDNPLRTHHDTFSLNVLVKVPGSGRAARGILRFYPMHAIPGDQSEKREKNDTCVTNELVARRWKVLDWRCTGTASRIKGMS